MEENKCVNLMLQNIPQDFVEKLFSAEVLEQVEQDIKNNKPFNIKNDIGFKIFLCHNSKESNYCLKKIIGAFTHQTVENCKIVNTELLPEFLTGKSCRLDVNVEFNNGQKADFELQLECETDKERKRSVFYAAKQYVSSLKKGEDYEKITNVYQVFFTDFKIFNDNEYFHEFNLKDNAGNVLTDSFNVSFLEMPKLKKLNYSEKLKEIEFWGIIVSMYDEIKNGKIKIKGFDEELFMIELASRQIKDSKVERAMQLARELNEYEAGARAAFWKKRQKEAEEKGYKQGMTKGFKKGIEKGIEQGIEKGIEQGLEKGILKAAVIAVKGGFPLDKAVKDFDLKKEVLLKALEEK